MIEQTTINGVPTLVAPASGPLRGGITFRVGRADESLPRSGITHLVEHLALHRFGLTDYHYNGATGSAATHFVSQGSPEHIRDYIDGVCTALADLPFERLAMEKEILRTESANRSRSAAEPLLLWRYGAQGYGLLAYPEWGLDAHTADDLRDWVSRYFTRDNAVLWFTGPPPPDLRVPLPSGERMPLPPTTSALPRTPAYFPGPPQAVALHTVITRSVAAQVFAGVLERELFRALRQEGGYSYAANAAYEPHDSRLATIVGLVDTHPEKQDAALGGFVDVLAKLRAGRVEQGDIDAMLAKAREALREPDADANRLPVTAFDVLVGGPNQTAEEVLRQLDEVTVSDVHRVAKESAENALLMVPQGLRGDWAGFDAAPTSSATAIRGRRYPMRNGANCSLLVGPEGVSTTAPGSIATVRFDECVAVLAWPDGGLVLVGNDGITCSVEPTLYPIGATVRRRIEQAVPPHLVVHLRPRAPDTVPQPPALDRATERRLRRESPERRKRSERLDRLAPRIALALALVALAACGGFFAVLRQPVGARNDSLGGAFFVVAIVATLAILWPLGRAMGKQAREPRLPPM